MKSGNALNFTGNPGVGHFMRLSLRKAAHAAMSSAAWQEIRVTLSRRVI
jgi:hypothetical protein